MWYLNSTEWYLVETNYDHWLPDPPKDDRRCDARALCECALMSTDRTIAQAALNQVGEADINLSTLWKVLSVPQGASVCLRCTSLTPDSPQRRHHVHRRDRAQQWHAHHLRSLSASHVLSSH